MNRKNFLLLMSLSKEHASPPARLTSEQTESIRDMLLLELGPDCLGWPESKAMAWLNSHRTSMG